MIEESVRPDHVLVSYRSLMEIENYEDEPKERYAYLFEELPSKHLKKPCLTALFKPRKGFECLPIDWRYLELLTFFGCKLAI